MTGPRFGAPGRILRWAAVLAAVAAGLFALKGPLRDWFFLAPAGPASAPATRPHAPKPPPIEAPELPEHRMSDPGFASSRLAMDRYEDIRVLLAADRLDGIDQAARAASRALEAALAAEPDAPSPVRDAMGDAANASARLAAAEDLEKARLRFGELGRQLVGVARADQRLQEGFHLFDCPMAEGYRKWFQRSPRIENAYMGQQMLECGSASPWDPPPADDLGAISHEGHGHEGDEVAHHVCPMHPSVRQRDMGTCPICGMDLVPVSYDEVESGVIRVEEGRRQTIGVRTAAVVRRPLERTLTALGRVTWDETGLFDVTLKRGGFVRTLRVNASGQMVKKGEVLFTLYSPELLSAQEEFLLAVTGERDAKSSAEKARSANLVASARRRLDLWDLPGGLIDRIAKKGAPIEAVPFFAPVSGVVLEKDIVEGGAVSPQVRLYRIAPVDRVWVEADLFSSDISDVAPGQAARVEVEGRTIEANVSHVFSWLDVATRTVRVRIEVPNPGGELRPGQFARVELPVERPPRLLVPREAVLYAGPRRLVFLDLGGGRLRPVEVRVGNRSEAWVEILDGLKEGQIVVSSGNFLIAAESRLRSAVDHFERGADDGAK